MERQDIYLNDWDWTCHIFYETGTSDAETVLTLMEKMGCDDYDLLSAEYNLYSGAPNTGLTYSRFKEHESVIAIGKTSSADEFQSTFDHEKGHLCKHICQALKIDPFGEEAEYLAGEIGRKMFSVAKKFMCDNCRAHKSRFINLHRILS